MLLGSLEAEAMAMTEGVRFAWEVRIRDAVFECDSKIVFDVILGYLIPPISIDNVIVGIRQQMEAFRIIKDHIEGTGNHLAHILAQFAKYINSYIT